MAEIIYRDLTVDNLFDFCTVLDAIGTDQVIGVFDKREIAALQKAGKNEKGVGIAIAMKVSGILIKNLPKAKEEICTFFANCMIWDNGSQVTADEIKNLKIGLFAKLMREFFEKEDLTDFFEGLAGLLDTGQPGSKN